jgi:hypothetical protein
MRSLLLAVFCCAALVGQGEQTVVQGTVVDTFTGAPLAGVHIAPYDARTLIAITDASGFFRLQGVTGDLRVARSGYVGVSVAAVQGRDLAIRLSPEAVISGTVTDEDGFPAAGGQVQALRYQFLIGGQSLRPVGWGNVNDLGQYRIAGLFAGRYYLRVVNSSAMKWDSRYVSQYFGGGLQPNDEHMVELKAGERREQTDIHLVKFEGVTVAGRVETSPGSSPAWARLQGNGEFAGFATSHQPDGTFVIRHVNPGSYTLVAQSGVMIKAGDLIAQMPLEVGSSDLRDLVLTPHAAQAVDVAGTLTVEGGGNPGPTLIRLQARFGGGFSAHSDADGSFVLKGVVPGHYGVSVAWDYFSATEPRPGVAPIPTSVRWNDKEALTQGFDIDGPAAGPLRITLGKPIQILGKIVDASGQPVAGAAILFVPLAPARMRDATSDANGAFEAALLAGDYRVYVPPDQSEALDLDFVKAHENDFPVVHVVAGENPPLMLRQPAQ